MNKTKEYTVIRQVYAWIGFVAIIYTVYGIIF